MQQNLVIKVTTGHNDPEKAIQGLTVAATALASGVSVSLWVASSATSFVVQDGEDLEIAFSPPASALIAAIAAEGTIKLCAQCAKRRELTEADLIDGVSISGAASYVAEVTQADTQALIY